MNFTVITPSTHHIDAIDHRDSLGTQATLRPGACNLMTAARGIVHSERTPQGERATGSPISRMQTRVARQRAVNKALGDLPGQRVHALAIRALAPGE